VSQRTEGPWLRLLGGGEGEGGGGGWGRERRRGRWGGGGVPLLGGRAGLRRRGRGCAPRRGWNKCHPHLLLMLLLLLLRHLLVLR